VACLCTHICYRFSYFYLVTFGKVPDLQSLFCLVLLVISGLISFFLSLWSLRYLLWKLIRPNLCKHSLYLGFDLNFSRTRILLSDDLERL